MDELNFRRNEPHSQRTCGLRLRPEREREREREGEHPYMKKHGCHSLSPLRTWDAEMDADNTYLNTDLQFCDEKRVELVPPDWLFLAKTGFGISHYQDA